MTATRIRAGDAEDTEWLYQLFRQTNQEFIDATWGWDELLQKEAFTTNLPGNQFRILEVNGNTVGGYHLANRSDHLWLEMLLVRPDKQRQGFATLMMNEIKATARSRALPVRLKVLRTNPAQLFYINQGFVRTDTDDNSLKMAWIEK